MKPSHAPVTHRGEKNSNHGDQDGGDNVAASSPALKGNQLRLAGMASSLRAFSRYTLRSTSSGR